MGVPPSYGFRMVDGTARANGIVFMMHQSIAHAGARRGPPLLPESVQI
jgi:hypothetical protein